MVTVCKALGDGSLFGADGCGVEASAVGSNQVRREWASASILMLIRTSLSTLDGIGLLGLEASAQEIRAAVAGKGSIELAGFKVKAFDKWLDFVYILLIKPLLVKAENLVSSRSIQIAFERFKAHVICNANTHPHRECFDRILCLLNGCCWDWLHHLSIDRRRDHSDEQT